MTSCSPVFHRMRLISFRVSPELGYSPVFSFIWMDRSVVRLFCFSSFDVDQVIEAFPVLSGFPLFVVFTRLEAPGVSSGGVQP